MYWDEGVDVWENPANFKFRHTEDDEYANGEGLYVYPGTKDRVGFDGPVPSMRFFWIREAVEDYEYIKLLRAKGEDDFIKEQTLPLLRHIGDWDDNIDALNAARRNMGKLLSESN